MEVAIKYGKPDVPLGSLKPGDIFVHKGAPFLLLYPRTDLHKGLPVMHMEHGSAFSLEADTPVMVPSKAVLHLEM